MASAHLFSYQLPNALKMVKPNRWRRQYSNLNITLFLKSLVEFKKNTTYNVFALKQNFVPGLE